MQKLIGKHVQIVSRIPQLNNYCGILNESEAGPEFLKLIPWDDAFQKEHSPWARVVGEVHMRISDIVGIIDLNTIDGKAIQGLNGPLFTNNFS
jgi:hypothetical protein